MGVFLLVSVLFSLGPTIPLFPSLFLSLSNSVLICPNEDDQWLLAHQTGLQKIKLISLLDTANLIDSLTERGGTRERKLERERLAVF